MTLLREVIGARVRVIRKSQKLKLREASKKCGLSLGYMSEIERGVKDPSSEIIEKLCVGLDVELFDLLYDNSPKPAEVQPSILDRMNKYRVDNGV